jgi:serine phosphatase RsbU (regulator of sigma subunit)
MLIVRGTSGLKSLKHSRWKFGFLLAAGALVALALCVQCVRTYLYTVQVLIPQQAEQEAAREAGALNAAARSAGIDNPRKLAPLLEHAVQSAADRILWVRVLDSDGDVLCEAGSPPATLRVQARAWHGGQKDDHRGTLLNTSKGKALWTMLPLRMPRRSRADDRHVGYAADDRRVGYALDFGISLIAVSEIFGVLRENLILGMIASLALLLSLAVIAMRVRQYLRGQYLESELQLARRVQSDLQPKPYSMSPYIQFAASAVAADHVGGDFYDVFELDSGKLAVVLGDVSGKGIPAALLVSVLQGAIRSSTASRHELACERINRMLCERTASERFATLFWGVFDLQCSTFRYVNAGHAAPMLVRKDRNRIDRLDEGGPILGCLPEAKYLAGEVQVHEGDTLILYTDGVSEAANERAEEFGEERILQTLTTAPDVTPAVVCEHLTEKVSAFAGAQRPAEDDRTLLVVRFSSSVMSMRTYDPRQGAMTQVA